MKAIYSRLCAGETALAVIGLGYVGLPLAVALSDHLSVIGFDINREKIRCYLNGHDVTREAGDEKVKNSGCYFTGDERDLDRAGFFIVAVPTPISYDKTPDLTPVISASRLVGRHLKPGSIVVYESTVYPGVTESVCAKLLEEESGLLCGADFKIGYSPERINPGDKAHRLDTIVKIVSGMDKDALENIAGVYELIVKAGVYRAESIMVAEAAKVVENSQRDINIAFMNELAMIFDRMEIDTRAVIRAMNTKWNALGFYPGLVGGHCIGVDPYYFLYRAEQLGYPSQIISAGRRINNEMSEFVAGKIVREMLLADKAVKGARLAVLGITFKEDCPDTRNTRVVDIMKELEPYEMDILVVDPVADAEETYREYGISLVQLAQVQDADAVLAAVAHTPFRSIPLTRLGSLQRGLPLIIDIKGMFDPKEAERLGYRYWSL